MTTTAMILTSGFVLIAVCGLLSLAFRAIDRRKTYVEPDDTHTRFITLRSPQQEEEEKGRNDV